MPDGQWVSLNELEAKFNHVPREERGRLSKLALAALPRHERERIKKWAASKTKANPAPDGLTELMVFFALGHSTPSERDVFATVEMIVSKQSAIGIVMQPS